CIDPGILGSRQGGQVMQHSLVADHEQAAKFCPEHFTQKSGDSAIDSINTPACKNLLAPTPWRTLQIAMANGHGIGKMKKWEPFSFGYDQGSEAFAPIQ